MRAAVVITGVVLVASLTGCVSTPEITPVVVDLTDLQGETVEVPLDSELIIVTDWTLVDTYTAQIADPAIAEFERGAETGEAAYTPRIVPLQAGDTEVTLSSEEDDLDDVSFTLEITD